MLSKKSIYQVIEVIKLRDEDLESCMELDKIVFNGIWNIHQWQKELNDTRRLCIGGFEGKKLVSLASGWFAVEEINITLLAVNPFYRRLGIGKLMLTELLRQSKSSGAKIATLEVKEKNHAAKNLYKSLNFQVIGHRSSLYRDGSNAIIYQRNTC